MLERTPSPSRRRAPGRGRNLRRFYPLTPIDENVGPPPTHVSLALQARTIRRVMNCLAP
jgi:hypothetical protein